MSDDLPQNRVDSKLCYAILKTHFLSQNLNNFSVHFFDHKMIVGFFSHFLSFLFLSLGQS